jgi:hypothetical protein
MEPELENPDKTIEMTGNHRCHQPYQFEIPEHSDHSQQPNKREAKGSKQEPVGIRIGVNQQQT